MPTTQDYEAECDYIDDCLLNQELGQDIKLNALLEVEDNPQELKTDKPSESVPSLGASTELKFKNDLKLWANNNCLNVGYSC